MRFQPQQFASRFRIVAIAALAVLALDARAHEAATAVDPLENPDVVAAIRTVWNYTLAGRAGIEASFRLDGKPSGYRVVVAPLTNQFRKHKLQIVPGATFALFHVHTAKAEPAPSPGDRDIADKYKLKVYSIHHEGLYEYDPATKKTTKLREGAKWMNAGSAAGSDDRSGQ